MIRFLQGLLDESGDGFVIIDVQGLGYRVEVPATVLAKLPEKGRPIRLETYLLLKEDGVQLFGFHDPAELGLFEQLLTVSGIGPRAALGLISYLPGGALAQAVVNEDLGRLTRVPGIGKKTAQRLILELKDKFVKQGLVAGSVRSPGSQILMEAGEALAALGYGHKEAWPVLEEIWQQSDRDVTVAELTRQALKVLGRQVG